MRGSKVCGDFVFLVWYLEYIYIDYRFSEFCRFVSRLVKKRVGVFGMEFNSSVLGGVGTGYGRVERVF